ncbi:MAG: T9SS type A sorting domain-containing protein [Ignavibacteria bacterium]|nr:T9SS type A sorting domain-containing protein [Ignavibacteria bacterium]
MQISKLSKVKLVVFDITGREVETLVNEQLKPGTYEVDFNGSKLSSGVYFYKMITDDFVETKKMVLVK